MSTLPSIQEFNEENKSQRLLGVLLKLSTLLLLISTIPDLFFLVYKVFILNMVIVIMFGVAYYFNKKGYTTVSANILIISLSVLIFIQSIQLGVESYVQVFYLPVIIGIPFILENKKLWVLLFHLSHILLFCTLSFIFVKTTLFIHPSSAYMHLSAPINLGCSIILCGFFVRIMVLENQKSQKLLLESQRKLQEQNNELIKTNRELDHLVYSISHDLRAPIASALGLIELSKIEEDRQQLKYYEQLKESCLKRLDSFIIEVLNYLKNNRLNLNIEEVNIKNEIDFVVKMNSSFSQNVSIMTNLEFTNNLYTDKNRLRIILNNLISNAIRYSRIDGEEKFVNIVSKVRNGEVIISIQDNGIGIHPQHLNKIFDMFFQSSDKSKGSGLGLYITREALEKIHGRIEVSSQTGVGSLFTVYLPDLRRLICDSEIKTQITEMTNEEAEENLRV